MPDLSKVQVVRVNLSLTGDGADTYTPTFKAQICSAEITGGGAAVTGDILVDGVSQGTFPLTAGAGSKTVTKPVKAASDATYVATNVNAQLTNQTTLGENKQANATAVGYANTLAPSVADDAPIATVNAGQVITVKHNVAAAAVGSAVLTLWKV